MFGEMSDFGEASDFGQISDLAQLAQLDRHLCKALQRYQDLARVRGDFLETVLAVHHILDRGLDDYLRRKGEFSNPALLDPERVPRFEEKVVAAVPEMAGWPGLQDLAHFYEVCAYPDREFYESVADEQIRQAAIDYVNLALEVWPRLGGNAITLFGEPPQLVAQEDILNSSQIAAVLDQRDQLQAQLEQARAEIEQDPKRLAGAAPISSTPAPAAPHQPAGRKLPWSALVIGLVALLPIPLLAGAAYGFWDRQPRAWTWTLIPMVLLLVLALVALVGVGRFLRPRGIVRLISALSVALVAVTVAFMPFTPEELSVSEKAGAALQRVTSLAGRVTGAPASIPFNAGADLAGSLLPGGTRTRRAGSTLASLSGAQPAPTPGPTPTPIPGWKKLEGLSMELWLPASFEGGDVSQDLDTIVANLKALGPQYADLAKTIQQNPSVYALWALDTGASRRGFITNVSVTKERVPSAITVDSYITISTNSLPDGFNIIDRKTVALDRYEAGQLTIDFQLPSGQARELMYVVKDGATMWVMTYATSSDEFSRRKPVFEQSANTFRVNP